MADDCYKQYRNENTCKWISIIYRTNTIEYGAAFAGALVSLLPMFVLYMFGQKYFVEGMSSGGLKG